MCGICGYIGSSFDKEKINQMTLMLKHRGPDAQAIYTIHNGALGQARLAIIDLHPNSNQPFESHDGRYVITYNGEIYNYKLLREQCRSLGSKFRSESDTEVIIESYRHWGIHSFQKLNGIFAFALYDKIEDKIVLCRDRWGVKPLYYSYVNNELVFGSEIKAILAYKNTNNVISMQAFHEFMYYGNPIGEQTFFEDICKLKAGSFLTFNKDGLRNEFYWKIEDQQYNCPDTLLQAVEKVKIKLENAVELQLVADVPVGIFLSGGVDSSAITAFASKHYQSKINTYSVGFDFDDGHNELPMARMVANQFNTNHHELIIKGANIIDTIEKLVWHHDEPFSDAANIPLYLLSKELNGNVKVVLQGDGGDEMFGGYKRYKWLPYAAFISKIKPLLKIATLMFKSQNKNRLNRFLHQVGENDPGLRMAYMLTEENINNPPIKLLHADIQKLLEGKNPFSAYITINEKLNKLDLPQRLLWTDSQLLMQHQFLEKVDRSTLAFGLEVRVPFLENELSEYALSLPYNYKVNKWRSKHVLKKALQGVIPNEVLTAKKKGFGVPYGNWLKGPLHGYFTQIVLDTNAKHASIFDLVRVRKLLDEHKVGQFNHSFMLWKILQFCLWYKTYDVRLQ